jgi:hypothetical protein
MMGFGDPIHLMGQQSPFLRYNILLSDIMPQQYK